MDSSSLLASLAAAFAQDRRLLTLQLGNDDQWEGVPLPQSDDIEIGAAKKLHLYALILEAPKITIKASNAGAEYGGGIVTKTTAAHVQHAGNHSMQGPARLCRNCNTRYTMAWASWRGLAVPTAAAPRPPWPAMPSMPSK